MPEEPVIQQTRHRLLTLSDLGSGKWKPKSLEFCIGQVEGRDQEILINLNDKESSPIYLSHFLDAKSGD
jgi:hypothetical protein